ncbi:7-dehydrocholesterol reductase-like isoform X2 [Humulus lupulus]|nr:7-dehydrocholesterol reductase-like isoform X2 [Humulus lupulus]
MLVNTILMLVYVTKFFWWEAGYWSTMDIAHDRAGFYICWGCLVWVPSIYTSPGMYLVNHPVHLGTQLALYILVAGILCIYINYDCDRQRQEFRRTNGKALVWGKAPSKITATYTTTTGETKSSILLTSGWLYPTFMWCFLQSFSSAGRKGMMIGADPSMENTGNRTARRFGTGSSLEFTEKMLHKCLFYVENGMYIQPFQIK